MSALGPIEKIDRTTGVILGDLRLVSFIVIALLVAILAKVW